MYHLHVHAWKHKWILIVSKIIPNNCGVKRSKVKVTVLQNNKMVTGTSGMVLNDFGFEQSMVKVALLPNKKTVSAANILSD